MAKTIYWLYGIAAAFGIGLGLGVNYNEDIKKGEEYICQSIDNHIGNNPRYKRTIEFLSIPRKKLNEWVHGKPEAKESGIEKITNEYESK